MESLKFILRIIEWGIVLACAGQLATETTYYKEAAIENHQRGLMSLGAWSKKLGN